jgi:superoxide oxidase
MDAMHALVNVASHPTKLSGKAGRFDQISIALHWLTVLLVFAQFATAWLLVEGGDGARIVLAVHRAIGAVIWIVVALHLFWRCSFAYLPAFTASMPKLQQRVAKLSEYGLYGLLLVQPLTGLGNTLLRGRPFTIGAWQVPALFAPDGAFARVFELLHELGAWALLALIGLHAVAALFHTLILRDGLLQRMLPWPVR